MNHFIQWDLFVSQSGGRFILRALAMLGALAIVGLSTPVTALAETLHYQGAPLSEGLAFTDVESHNEYEYIEVPDTCYRTEYVEEYACRQTERSVCETRNVCQDVPDSVCRTGPGGDRTCTPISRRTCSTENFCHTVPDTVCGTETRAVSVPYACTTTQTITHKIDDYTLDLDVNIRIAEAPASARADETLSITTTNGALKIQSQSLFNELLLFSKETRHVEVVREKSSGELGHKRIFIDTVIIPTAVSEAAELLKGGIKNLRLDKGGIIRADLGSSFLGESLFVQIDVKRHVTMAPDESIFSGPVRIFPKSTDGNSTPIEIDLKKVHLFIPASLRSGSRYNLKLSISARDLYLDKSLINPEALGPLKEASATVKKQRLLL